MRYTEEKETKNKPISQAVTASMRWAKSAYSSFLAICKTASLSSGRSLWTGSLGPGLRFRRLWPFFFFLHHRTTRRRLTLQKAQVLVTGRPFSLACSIIIRISNFCSSLSHWPFISPTNPHSFFFAGLPTPLPDQPGLVPSPATRVSGLHNLPEAQPYALNQGEHSNDQGLPPLPVCGSGPNRWNISLLVLKFLQLKFYRFAILRIFKIFSREINSVVSFLSKREGAFSIFFLVLKKMQTPLV